MFNESNASSSDLSDSEKSNKRGNIVFRQELRSLTPKCNVKFAIVFFSTLLLTFFILGFPLVITGYGVVSFSVDYSECKSDSLGYCTLSLNINQTIRAPVYFYYELHNFYGNHRDFVKSRSYPQLRGKTDISLTACEGAKYVKEVFDNDTTRFNTPWGVKLNPNDVANPCGLVAKAYFNDTDFTLKDSQGTRVPISETGIANHYDLTYMFKRNSNYNSTQWIDVENEHFVVWMQMETFQNFRKLWGSIDQDVTANNYTLRVKNNYNVTSFGGKKNAVFTNITPFGVGGYYGSILLLASLFAFIILCVLFYHKMKYSNRVYTLKDLKWD